MFLYLNQILKQKDTPLNLLKASIELAEELQKLEDENTKALRAFPLLLDVLTEDAKKEQENVES